jgi:quinol monooxygenase YgiN
MPYVVCAKWTAKEGEEGRLWEAAQKWIGPTRQEPGNLMYIVHRDPENPRTFFFYEQYTDAAGFQAHRDSPHFQEHAVGTAIPLLEAREVSFYETVDV